MNETYEYILEELREDHGLEFRPDGEAIVSSTGGIVLGYLVKKNSDGSDYGVVRATIHWEGYSEDQSPDPLDCIPTIMCEGGPDEWMAGIERNATIRKRMIANREKREAVDKAIDESGGKVTRFKRKDT